MSGYVNIDHNFINKDVAVVVRNAVCLVLRKKRV